MSISSINSNLASLLSKAYSADGTSDTGNQTIQQLAEELTGSSNTSNSTSVSLGNTGSGTETYTAQGLLTQMRQFQRDNANILFEDSSSDSNDSLFGSSSTDSSDQATDVTAMSKNWVETISNDPDKAQVMVQSTLSDGLGTILGGN